MFRFFHKHYKILHSLVREHFKKYTRSSQWPKVRREFLLKNPRCAACNSTTFLQVHHKKPFHIWPELELDESNLITLCMKNLCHLEVGHGDNWERYNLYVVRDCMLLLLNPNKREDIVKEIKARCSINN